MNARTHGELAAFIWGICSRLTRLRRARTTMLPTSYYASGGCLAVVQG